MAARVKFIIYLLLCFAKLWGSTSIGNNEKECPDGQVFNECGSSCTKTCDDPNPMCIQMCVAKCECPSDKPNKIWHDGKCITEKECPGQTNDDKSPPDIVFIVLSQHNSYNSRLAQELKEDIQTQAKDEKMAVPPVLLTHEEWGDLTGAWTIQPLLPLLAKKYPDSSWFFFCEDETSVELPELLELLETFDPSKELFLGKKLTDSTATIIHHFAFHNDPSVFGYPDFAAGFLLSKPLLHSLAKRYETKKDKMDFSIDAKHEFAKFIWNEDKGVHLTHVPQFCVGALGDDCVTDFPTHLPDCGPSVAIDDIFFAIKTCEKFHTERVPVVQNTWGKDAKHIEFYSEKEDKSIPTIDLGVPNTERGHCGKFLAILKRAYTNPALSSKPWLVVADDDTLLSVSRLRKFLACYNPAEPIVLGERYGYGTTSTMGYDYITGGGGIVLSREAIHQLLSTDTAGCPSDDSPDDMLLGTWMKRLGIPLVHSSLFHQARPEDYSGGYLERHEEPISFHKHWMIDPYKVYKQWFEEDTKEKKHDEL